jgi:protein tyrosine/serine phosphatase
MKAKLISAFLLHSLITGLVLGVFTFAPAYAVEPAPRATAPIERFAKVTPFLYRGARPTQEGIAMLRKLGVKTILNIDNEAKPIAIEKGWAQALGIQYVSIPLSGFLAPTDAQMDGVFKVIHDPSNYPIFLHCKHGEDRTGLVVGLFRYNDEHWSAQAAYDEMLAYGFHKVLLGLNFYFKEKTGLIEAAPPQRVSNDDLILLGELQ